ncbi:hypothetical protein Bealeia2_01946 (plasmid) [Candidatus Bealeia paramacronuclearis]|uniref:hypothetical protein n=1 Tax=Candidatus Bealeia paramacronuclearis TaxID=1921001 RepID=UPI002B8A903C|nr:hypothetical protein [Candidatus Bealeia paramacronuclearis]
MPPSYTYSNSGGFVQPSNISYQSYTLKENLALVWASSFTNNPHVATALMNLKAEKTELSLRLPSAKSASLGQNIMMFNVGAHTIRVETYDGAKLLDLTPQQATYIYLINNETEAGLWSQIPFGVGQAVVSAVAATSDDATALKIDGSPITASGTLKFQLGGLLKSLVKIAGNGLAILKDGNWLTRTLQGGNQISVTDPQGYNGNPTIALRDPLAVNTLMAGNATIQALTVKQPITGDAIPKGSLPLDTLKGTTIAGAVIDNGKGGIELAPVGNSGNKLSVLSGSSELGTGFRPFTNVWNAQENTSLSGSKLLNTTISGLQLQNQTITHAQIANKTITSLQLADKSVGVAQLENSGRMVPFAMGVFDYSGTLLNGFNFQNATKVSGTDSQYVLVFIEAAPHAHFITSVTLEIAPNLIENAVLYPIIYEKTPKTLRCNIWTRKDKGMSADQVYMFSFSVIVYLGG